MVLPVDTILKIEDQGEGWFPLARNGGLQGSIVRVITEDGFSEPFYLFVLDSPLEVQEATNDTPSGLRLVIYNYLLIQSRWLGVALESQSPVSVHLRLPSAGQALPSTYEACSALPIRAWGTCSVMPTGPIEEAIQEGSAE